MSEVKSITRSQFRAIASDCERIGFNRQIAPWVITNLAKDKPIIIRPVLFHEHIAGRKVDLHLRTTVHFELRGRQLGSALVDMSIQTYESLSQRKPMPRLKKAA